MAIYSPSFFFFLSQGYFTLSIMDKGVPYCCTHSIYSNLSVLLSRFMALVVLVYPSRVTVTVAVRYDSGLLATLSLEASSK